MIVLVTGPPGSGKTYYTVRKVCDSLERGKFVATNVDFHDGWTDKLARGNVLRWLIPGRRAAMAERFAERTYVTPNLDELFRLRLPGKGESRGVMVLDEAHQWMNSRLWKDTDRLRIVQFFSQHRKLGWDIYLVTQDANNIDRQVRSLFEYHAQLRNLKKMRVLGVPVTPVNLFLCIWKWHAAQGAIVKREAYRLTGRAKYYDTMAQTHLPDWDGDDDLIYLPLKREAVAGDLAGEAAPAADDDRTEHRVGELTLVGDPAAQPGSWV